MLDRRTRFAFPGIGVLTSVGVLFTSCVVPSLTAAQTNGAARLVVIRASEDAAERSSGARGLLLEALENIGVEVRELPESELEPTTDSRLAAATEAYANLLPDVARSFVDELLVDADDSGGRGMDREQLRAVLVLLSLSALARGDDGAADDALDRLLVVDPEIVLDPVRYPPNLRARLESRRAAIGQAAAALLTVRSTPTGATLIIDGQVVPEGVLELELRPGPHLLRVQAPWFAEWGGRIELEAGRRVLTLSLEPDYVERLRRPGPPDDDAPVLLQAAEAIDANLLLVDLQISESQEAHEGRLQISAHDVLTERRARARGPLPESVPRLIEQLFEDNSGGREVVDGSDDVGGSHRRRRRVWIVLGSITAAVALGVAVGVFVARPWEPAAPESWQGQWSAP